MAKPAIDIDREQVRMLVLSIGVRPTAAKLGLPVSTVGTWSEEGKWLAHLKPQEKQALPTSMVNPNIPNISPSDALEIVLKERGQNTKLGLSKLTEKVANRVAEDTFTAEDGLSMAGKIKDIASVSQIVYGWNASDAGSKLQVNIFNDPREKL